MQRLGEALAIVALIAALLDLALLVAEVALLVLVLRSALRRGRVHGALALAAALLCVVHAAVAVDRFTVHTHGGRVNAYTLTVCHWFAVAWFGALCGAVGWWWGRGNRRGIGAALLGCLLLTLPVPLVIQKQLDPWIERPLAFTGTPRAAFGRSGYACILTSTGMVACRGDNRGGYIGTGERPWRREAWTALDGLDAVTTLTAGEGFTCALQRGRVYCWGTNDHGALGTELRGPLFVPTPLPGIDDAVEVLARGEALWVRTASGRVRGRGSERHHKSLTVDDNGPADAVQLAAAEGFHCLRLRDGAVRCRAHEAAVTVDVPGPPAVALAAADRAACVARSDGSVWCASIGFHPENALREQWERLGGIDDAVDLVAGARHFCARTRADRVLCWGEGFRGQLGDDTAESHEDPRPAALPCPAAHVFADEDETCAACAGDDRRLFCWGSDPPVATPRVHCHDSWVGEVQCVRRPTEVRFSDGSTGHGS